MIISRKISVNTLAWFSFLIVFMLQNIIEDKISIMKYFDEVVALVLGAIFFVTTIKKGIYIRDFKIISLLVLIITIGYVGSIISKIQPNFLLQMYDAFNIFKFIIVILGAQLVVTQIRNKEKIISILSIVIKILLLISTFFMILNLMFDVGMHTDIRYGIRTYNFIFSRVGEFYTTCLIWLIILTSELYYNDKNSNKIFIILCLINMCSTLRSRAIGFAIVYMVMYYLLIIKENKKINLWYLLPILFILYVVAQEQFEFYFNGDRARNILFRYGIITANTYFPLGSGFATYGTAISQKNYSPLYVKYNFSNYYGLSSDYGSFLTDNYWPAIIAQFGYLGVLLMSILITCVIKKMLIKTNNRYSYLSVLFIFTALLISSTASSSFFSCTSLVFFASFVSVLPVDNIRKNSHD